MSFASITLVKSAHTYKATTYQKLIERALGKQVGPAVSVLMSISVVFYLFGCSTSYLILLGDAIPSILRPVLEEDSFWIQRWVVITLPAILITLPLASVRRLSSLSGKALFRMRLNALFYLA
eukprot:1153295-Pyramimonas_sp.AAC.1